MRGQRGQKTGALLAVALAAGAITGVISMPRDALATSTRIYTLGVMNRFIIDDSNKWLYPHTITKYGNLFYLELFGSGPSRSTPAPTSERTTNIPAAPPMLAGTDFQSYDAADSVPVQQTAGGGAIVKVTDDVFISLHLSDYENPTVPALLGLLSTQSRGSPNAFPWLPVPPDAPATANRKFDVFAAYNMQDTMQFGLQITYGSSKYLRTPNDNDPEVIADLMGNTETRKDDAIKTSELGFLLGLGLELGDTAAVDAGLGITFHGLTYDPNQRSGDLIDGGGGIELKADVRALIGVTEWWEVVPAISFRYVSLTAADVGNFENGLFYNDDTGREKVYITDVAMRRLLLDIGTAGHFRPTDAIDFWGAVGLQFGRWSAEFDNTVGENPDAGYTRAAESPLEFGRDTISYDAVPYIRFAMEARIFSWLDFRGGVVKFLRADTTTEDKIDENDASNNRLNDVTRDDPFFDYFVGAAVHYEGFFLDMQVDPLWFMRGPDFLSGSGSNMFVNASLGYRF